VFSKIW